MGPHSRQQSTQQSTNIICYGSTSLKLEKKLFITSNMTVSARRVDDDVRKKCVDKVVDLSVGPTRQIRRWQRHSIRRMGVG